MYNEQIVFNNINRPTFVLPQTVVDKGLICPLHFHTELEFLCVNSGLVKYTAEDTEYIAKPGDVMFINSKVPHYTESLTDGSSHSFIQFKEPKMASGQLRYLARFLKLSDTPAYLFTQEDSDTAEIGRYINDIIKYYDNDEIHYDYYINGIMFMILSLLYRKKILNNTRINVDAHLLEKLNPVFDHIHENYSEELSLGDLSRILNLNEQYFCRLFKKATGSNVTDYVNFIRVYNAEKLMKTNMNISEIAEHTGFSSLSYFNRIFKKYKQYSPREYRKLSSREEGLLQ